MNTAEAKRVLETALLCAHEALTVNDLKKLFTVTEGDEPALEADTIKEILTLIKLLCGSPCLRHGVRKS